MAAPGHLRRRLRPMLLVAALAPVPAWAVACDGPDAGAPRPAEAVITDPDADVAARYAAASVIAHRDLTHGSLTAAESQAVFGALGQWLSDPRADAEPPDPEAAAQWRYGSELLHLAERAAPMPPALGAALLELADRRPRRAGDVGWLLLAHPDRVRALLPAVKADVARAGPGARWAGTAPEIAPLGLRLRLLRLAAPDDAEATRLLLAALGHWNRNVRLPAATTLARRGGLDAATRAALRAMAEHEADAEVRRVLDDALAASAAPPE